MSEYIGRTIGKYQIEALLGKGGMGQVFRARDTVLDRPVALKVLFANLAADPQFRGRFRDEAQNAARLNHPHIVTVYDFDEHDGLAYLVMELVTGGSLREVLRNPNAPTYPTTLARRLDLARQAAEALAYAHGCGMVHRDIKPDNLMLQPQVADLPRLKVVDFGLARLAEGSGRTATGMAMGTPAYMSPEQFRNAKDVDARTDIYALGVVLFELTTGMLPFRAATMAEAVFQHMQIPPPIPSTVRPDLPAALDAIVARCLAKSASDRFTSAAELAAALHSLTGDTFSMLISGSFMPDTPSSVGAAGQATVVQTGVQYAVPRIAALVGPSEYPRVQVVNTDGMLVSVVELPPGETTIGRLSDNVVVLPGKEVSRRHLRVTWDGFQVTATDLGASGGSFLGSIRLRPGETCAWPWGTLLRIGEYWLQLEKPQPTVEAPSAYDIGGASMIAPQASPVQAEAAQSSMFAATGRFAVLLEPETLTITPGRPAMQQVTVTNLGTTVDHVELRVAGVPREWVSAPGLPRLNPGTRASVTLTAQVPASAEAQAGERSVEVRARSRAHPEERGVALSRWVVQPFYKATLIVQPGLARGARRGRFRLLLQNDGNVPVHYRLSVSDESGELRCGVTPEEVSIAAGEQVTAILDVEKAVRLLGASRTYGISVTAHSAAGASELHASARYLQTALLPRWVVPTLGLVVAAVVLYGIALPAGLWGGVPGSGFLLNPTAPSADRQLAAAATARVEEAATVQAMALNVAAAQAALEAEQTSTLAALQAAGLENEQTAQAAAFEATALSLEATQTAALAVVSEVTSMVSMPTELFALTVTPATLVPVTPSAAPTPTVTRTATAARTTTPSITSAPAETPTNEPPTVAPTAMVVTPVLTTAPTTVAPTVVPTIAPTSITPTSVPPSPTPDTTAPDTTITGGPTGLVNANTASFTFTAEPGATFECRLDGGVFAPCISPHNLNGLPDALHTFEVRAIDGVGNVDATPASRIWTVDTTPPNTRLSGGPSDPSGPNVTFTFLSDASATFECRIDAGPFGACDDNTGPEGQQGYTLLSSGAHTFEVRAIDAAGNIDATPASRTWTVDATPPDTTIDSFEVNADATIATFAFSANEAATFECRVDSAAFAPCTSPQGIAGLPPGSHTFAARAIDIVGNIDPTPAIWVWTSY